MRPEKKNRHKTKKPAQEIATGKNRQKKKDQSKRLPLEKKTDKKREPEQETASGNKKRQKKKTAQGLSE